MLAVLTLVVALNVPVDKPVNTKLVAVALVNCKLVALTFVAITFVLVKLVAVNAPSVADVATSVDVVMSVALNVVMVLCVNLALAELNCEVTFKVPAVIPVFKFKLLAVTPVAVILPADTFNTETFADDTVLDSNVPAVML